MQLCQFRVRSAQLPVELLGGRLAPLVRYQVVEQSLHEIDALPLLHLLVLEVSVQLPSRAHDILFAEQRNLGVILVVLLASIGAHFLHMGQAGLFFSPLQHMLHIVDARPDGFTHGLVVLCLGKLAPQLGDFEDVNLPLHDLLVLQHFTVSLLVYEVH